MFPRAQVACSTYRKRIEPVPIKPEPVPIDPAVSALDPKIPSILLAGRETQHQQQGRCQKVTRPPWPPIAAHRPVNAPRPRAPCPPKTSPSTCSPTTKPPASSSTAPTIQEGLEAPQHPNRDSRVLLSINPKSSLSSSTLGIILRTMLPPCDPTDLAFFFTPLASFSLIRTTGLKSCD